MLRKIKVKPLAAESFGVRSMCTVVQTPDVILLLDAGVSLCPYRFNLPPHPTEFKMIINLRKKIAEAAEKTEVVTISHYHFDHHTPSYEDWLVNWTEGGETARQIYEGKRVFLKNPREKINPSQRHRAWLFQKTGGKHARTLEKADGQVFRFGKDSIIRFSEPVTHGPEGAHLGWVIMAEVECDGEKFMFAPDVQGPMSTHVLELIFTSKPQVAMVGGPPFYLGGLKVEETQLQRGLLNLGRLVKAVPLTILDHHALRDASWQDRTKQVYKEAASVGHKIMTAAEYAGEANLPLESRRTQLYIDDPPSKEFERWMHEGLRNQKCPKPPL